VSNVTVTVTVPAGDLVALAEAGSMLLRIAQQKSRTPDNSSYVREANAETAKRSQADVQHECACLQNAAFDAQVEAADTSIDAGAAFGADTSSIINTISTAIADGTAVIRPPHPITTLDASSLAALVPVTPYFVPAGPPPLERPLTPYEQQVLASTVPSPLTIAAAKFAALPPSLQGVELDKNGLPWDGRIHSDTKNKCKTGEWKNKRSLDPAILASVEGELRTAMAAAGPAVNQTAAIMRDATLPSPPAIEDAVVIPPAPPLAVTPPPPSACPTSFPEFLQIVTGRCTARVLTYDEVTKTCQKHGLAGIPLLNARPDLIPVIFAELEAIWLGRQA
jgi:hypothetical protein